MEQNIEPARKRRSRKLVSLALFVIIFSSIVFVGYQTYNRWYQERKEFIRMGFAEDKFPFRMLTERELAEKGLLAVESQDLINTPTRVRPEETYAIFRQALIDGDMDKAAECFVKEKKDEVFEGLQNVKSKGLLLDMLNDLPDKLEDTYFYTDDATGQDTKSRDLNHVALSSYYYVLKSDTKPRKDAHTISFEKNWDGDWKIEDL